MTFVYSTYRRRRLCHFLSTFARPSQLAPRIFHSILLTLATVRRAVQCGPSHPHESSRSEMCLAL